MRLLTNNPEKRTALEGYGITVAERIAVPGSPHAENRRYLATKRDRMGHDLSPTSSLDPVTDTEGQLT